MRICFFNSGFLPDKGGVATFAGNLAAHIAKEDSVVAVKVIAFNNSRPRHELLPKLEIFAFGRTSLYRMMWSVFKYVLRFRNFDVFHATNLFPVGWLVLLFAKFLFGKKVFVTIYGTDILTTQGSTKTRSMKKFTMKFANRMFAFSESTAALAQQEYRLPPRQLKVIYPGVNDELFLKPEIDVRKRYSFGKDDFLVLTVCQLIRRKGVDDLIRALGLIADPLVKLLVVGKGSEEASLRALSREMEVETKVIFAGPVENHLMANYYLAVDVFAMASKYLKEQGDIEGLGIVFLEAQYFGVPVIGTKSGGVPEAILDGKSGFVIKENDPPAIAERILWLKNNPEPRLAIGSAGKRFVRGMFSWKKSIDNHLQNYQESI